MPDNCPESRVSLLDESRIADKSGSFGRKSCKSCLIAGGLIVIIAIGLGVGLYYALVKDGTGLPQCADEALGCYCSDSKLGVYDKYAISTDSEPCAAIGRKILEDGGNAVDSIISVLLCMSVTIPESMGFGGGSLIVVYNATTDETLAIDARERAPGAANATMYKETKFEYSRDGPLAIAVPGELAGYWQLFTSHGSGRIEWSTLFNRSIKLCEEGFPVSEHLSTALKQKEDYIKAHKELSDVYVNPKTGQIFKKGEIMVQKTLGQTYKQLADADDPKKLFYEQLSQKIVEDIHKQKGWDIKPIITVEDFRNYTVEVRRPVLTQYKRRNITLHSFPLPGSGAVLSFIMNVMQRFDDLYPTAGHSDKVAGLYYHRLVETFKFAFAKRTHLGDADYEQLAREVAANLTSNLFAKQIKAKINDSRTYPSTSGYYDDVNDLRVDHGTAHVSVVDSEGNAVAVTTTVNSYFGSKVMSPSTGILMNDEMDDFSTGEPNDFGLPSTDSNRIEPGKRPLSSMCPSVFTDQTGLRLVIGGSGGPKITTAVASVAIRNLWFDEDIKQAIDSQRVHHQYFPDYITYEKYFPENLRLFLATKGHQLVRLGDGDRGAIIMAVSKKGGKLYANSDYRKGGTVDGL